MLSLLKIILYFGLLRLLLLAGIAALSIAVLRENPAAMYAYRQRFVLSLPGFDQLERALARGP